MDEGQIVACGTLPELLALSRATEVIELRLLEPLETLDTLRALDGVRSVESVGHELRISTMRAQQVLPRIYRAVSALGHSVVRTRLTPVTLDDVFIELTGNELRD
jgi:ABC-type multidrug transport system ATPase subunit